jgi:hypothetical protein
MATWVKNIHGARINIDLAKAVYVDGVPDIYGVDGLKVDSTGAMAKFVVIARYDMKDKLNVSLLFGAETKNECERYLTALFTEVPSISPLLVPKSEDQGNSNLVTGVGTDKP